jgi:hypothetical protein
MNKANVEWVAITREIAIISCETGEYWFLDLNEQGQSVPFSQPMTGKGTRASTAGLLNGAVALAFADLKQSTASLPRYIFDLVGSFHIARRTPGHLTRAAKRLRELNRSDIASYLETHAQEETGHDRLALKDLRALGLPAEQIVANLVPDGMQPLCDLFDRLSSAEYPVGCLGYCYCFESTAAMKQRSDIETLEQLYPKNIDASRFARTHSGLGSELGHMEDLIDFVAGLPAFDRTEIVKSTYETAVSLSDSVRLDGLMSDAAILAKIEAAAGQEIHLAT